MDFVINYTYFGYLIEEKKLKLNFRDFVLNRGNIENIINIKIPIPKAFFVSTAQH